MKELVLKIKRYNDLDPVKTGIAVLSLYSLILILISLLHEPWYDEAQAWQIARHASYYDILFHIPHYESHPPLWHLILSIPAKAGAPYEISIKLINIAFSILGVFLIELRSGFSNWIKTFIPFTYFIFYQYGIISRPYSMMFLALLLCALFFTSKDDKPLRFIASLVFLCLCSDYGLMIAGGITVAWLAELLILHKGDFIRELFCSDKKRLAGLIFLLLLAVFTVFMVYPAADMMKMSVSPVWQRFLMITFIAPSEAFLTDFVAGDLSDAGLSGSFGTVLACLISVFLWITGLILSYRRGSLLQFILPCAFFIALGTVYSTPHHYGIYVMLFIYEFWIIRQRPATRDVFPKLMKGNIPKISRYMVNIVMILAVVISSYWTWSAVINDAAYPYFFSRQMASWLKENTKEEDVVMASWCPVYMKDSQGNDILDKPESVFYNSVAEIAVPLDPYFVQSPVDNEIRPYQFLGQLSEEELSDYRSRIKLAGKPDYILTYNENYIPGFLSALDYGTEEYELVSAFVNYRLFKDNMYYYNVMVYKRASD